MFQHVSMTVLHTSKSFYTNLAIYMTTAAKATVDDPSTATTNIIHSGATADAGTETHFSSETENNEFVCITIENQE